MFFWLPYLLAADAAAVLVMLIWDLSCLKRLRAHEKPRQEEGQSSVCCRQEEEGIPWQELYCEEHGNRENGRASGAEWEQKKPEEQKVQEMFQTVLLSDSMEEEGVHYLEAVSPGAENIEIRYYPFIIGKHRELADYVLNRSTVSRFHIRCDKEGEDYMITDLNSTNGTRVGGRLLNANETVCLQPGDEVVIADEAYIWR